VTSNGNDLHRCDLLCPVAHPMHSVLAFVDPETTLRAASQTMVAQGNGAVVVLGPEGPTSIVTERDIVSALAQEADPDTVWVADVASSHLTTIEPTATILEAIRHMASERVRYVPVKDNGEVVGLVVSEDLVDLVAATSASTQIA
jgi:signal-transduction protein with cAMP-binding, CBS, and nucleotidyltransferase domain